MASNKIKQRFVKDYNLPINVFDDEMFNYYIELYDFFPIDVWNKLNGAVTNPEEWLNKCAAVRDRAITETMATLDYQTFNTKSMEEYNIVPPCGERSCYNETTDGKRFISIDLKKANFQALKYAGVLKDDTYADFIKKFGGDEYMINSKYLRQVIFGKMNAGRTIKVEKYIMNNIYQYLNPFLADFCLTIFSMNSDEIVYEVHGMNEITEDILVSIETEIADKFGIDVRVEYIEIKRLPIVNVNGNKVDAYVRRNLVTGEEVLKKASTTFFPQIYKLWKGMEITEKDRIFFFEDQYATFNEPLRLESDEDISNK